MLVGGDKGGADQRHFYKRLMPAGKINITVPRLVLARIDKLAKKKGQSRYGFLVEAARTAMDA